MVDLTNPPAPPIELLFGSQARASAPAYSEPCSDNVMGGVSAGGRNMAGASIAGKLISAGLHNDDGLKLLKGWNQQNNPPMSDKEVESIWHNVLMTDERNHNGQVEIICGSDIQPEPIEWLWLGHLATGKLHILAGAPGTGKTTIAINLAAVMTQGWKWPDGTQGPKFDVAIWSGEDDPADTLVPRMIAAGADMTRVHFIKGINTGEKSRPFDPAEDMPALRTYLRQHPEIKLLIVDPVVSAVAGDSHKNTEVRRSLQPLVDLGQECNVAILGISHFSKGTAGRDPLERVTGSIAFGAVARIVLAAAKIEDGSQPEGTRLFCRSKSNIGPDSGGFLYRLDTQELDHYPGVYTSAVQWLGPIEGSARDLLAASEPATENSGSALAEAEFFLMAELDGGPKPAKKILAAARGAGIAEKTLRRAKDSLGVIAQKAGMSEGWTWGLPAKMATDSRRCPPQNDGHLRDVWPSSENFTGLEDANQDDMYF